MACLLRRLQSFNEGTNSPGFTLSFTMNRGEASPFLKQRQQLLLTARWGAESKEGPGGLPLEYSETALDQEGSGSQGPLQTLLLSLSQNLHKSSPSPAKALRHSEKGLQR